jgi:catechol 2,3-dioxygenase-like lactoylglutathione lyase family enzyme
MLQDSHAFSGFSVDDVAKAKAFYAETLGLKVTDQMGGLQLHIEGGNPIFVYSKPDHQPATFTILNFPVKDVEKTVDDLTANGVQFEHYDDEYLKTNEKGICIGDGVDGPKAIAWFKDPAGNILSVLEENL